MFVCFCYLILRMLCTLPICQAIWGTYFLFSLHSQKNFKNNEWIKSGCAMHWDHYKTLFSLKLLHIWQLFWQPHLLSFCVLFSVLLLANMNWQSVVIVSKQFLCCWASSQQASCNHRQNENPLLQSWIIIRHQ